MTISPGEEALAADITSRYRAGTGFEDTDSSTFTTSNTIIATVTAALVSGRTYRVKLVTHVASTVASDTVSVDLREDTIAGTIIQQCPDVILTTSAPGRYIQVETDYTAVSTGNKTFVAVAVRQAGSGTLRREAAAARPTLLTVDYAHG